ncbi:hypothetical protein BDF20DRAFT_988334 [Mycotypha africana]|uniref:uncharacterized protein n=1 Tax=Mycotypha africana TaxID=64632 RepID=UPI0023014BD6|nr:uncharacterized protein BDF20DRAFT_988334 [Mycotypha africana]KAI8977358.1 hypothetical protein BDF20DRAFT_988334 [Mycotypha africana]
MNGLIMRGSFTKLLRVRKPVQKLLSKCVCGGDYSFPYKDKLLNNKVSDLDEIQDCIRHCGWQLERMVHVETFEGVFYCECIQWMSRAIGGVIVRESFESPEETSVTLYNYKQDHQKADSLVDIHGLKKFGEPFLSWDADVFEETKNTKQ